MNNQRESYQEVTEVSKTRQGSSSGQIIMARIIWYITGFIVVLLLLRFVLSLLGANTSNAFASLIYNLSYPFVAPFFSLFRYEQIYGVSNIEIFTLVAMAIYALIGWGIVRLITINRN